MRHDLQHTWSRHFLQRAVDLALQAEQQGNLPVGAVLVLGDRIVAESASRPSAVGK